MNWGVPTNVPSTVSVALAAFHELDDTEIEDLRDEAVIRRLRQEDVVRLDVAMNDSRLVRALQSTRDLRENSDGLRKRQPLHAMQISAKRFPLEVLHHDVRRSVRQLAAVEYLHAEPRLESSRGARLARKTRAHVLGQHHRSGDDSDSHALAQSQVSARPYGPHAAAPEARVEAILTSNDGTCSDFIGAGSRTDR